MIFKQYYLGCLSQASYLIGDETTGRAIVIDPRRDIAQYLSDAQTHNLTIELVIETHFHADFLSGHLELAAATGAKIAFGAAAAEHVSFPIHALTDKERISLGDVTVEVRETPGHTPESIILLVYAHATDEIPYGALTGDTLFIGDVGRPDLLDTIGKNPRDMAASLYHSLHEKILSLPDETRVFPGHGAGSACGRNLSATIESTIGEQRATNYALALRSQEAFVEMITKAQPPAPGYFLFDAIRNRENRPLFDETQLSAALSLDQVSAHCAQGAVVVDTRSPVEFAKAHLVGSINVGLEGRYAEYAGSVIAPETSIILVATSGREQEAKIRLSRIGYDNILGFLEKPEEAFMEAPHLVQQASRLTASEMFQRQKDLAGLVLIDVRSPSEYKLEHLPGAISIPLPQLHEKMGTLNPEAPTVVYCRSSYQSSIAASLLRKRGFADVSDLLGGKDAADSLSGRTITAS